MQQPPLNKSETTKLKHILSSEECRSYFHGLSKISGLELSVYDKNGLLLLMTNQNPICKLIKSSPHGGTDCPNSCGKYMSESLKLNEPTAYKCYSKIMNFSVPINYLKEKAVIVGRSGFASYEDFREFLKIAKEQNLREVPISTPLNFSDENYMESISTYIHKVITYLLDNLQKKHELNEKLSRFTSLADIKILGKLSKNINSLYRYITDTIEFIFGPTSVAILALDNQTSKYKTTSAIGKYKDLLMGLQFDSKNSLIHEIRSTKIPVFSIDLNTEKLIETEPPVKKELLHLFPFFIGGIMGGLIGVFEKELPQEDIKIIDALRDYIEVALENHALITEVDKKLEGILVSVSNLSESIAPVLNWEKLLQMILEKSIQLLNAEQGSLMLLNHETSELLTEANKSTDYIPKEQMRVHLGEKIAGKVLESGDPLLVEDVEKDPRTSQKNKSRYKTKSFIILPIKIEDRVEGVLNISDKITGNIFNKNDLKLIQSFIPNAAIAIERSSLYKKIKQLKKLSLTDPLTGILNRRCLNSRLSEEIARFKRYKHTFSFLMLDIDGFKKYNDTYGHITGDKALKILANTITSSIRNIDIVARFGGDEFVVILPQTPKTNAINIGNRIKEDVEKSYITTWESLPENHLTVSIGLSSYPEDASSITELLEKTDQALYLAKKGGRNKLVYL